VAEHGIRLYGIALSHPVLAVRAMLARKGLAYRYHELLGGMHPPVLFALGFRGATVPAMKLADGRRVQGSLAIARTLEELAPVPALYPAEPAARAAAQEAERWGESTLQPVPRRLIRWGLRHHLSQRRWFADTATPLPAPGLMAVLLTPVVPIFVHQAGASDERVQRDLAELPALLDEVDRLLGEGVLGGDELGAADFQIGASVRVLLALQDVRPLVAGRPAEALSLRVVPDYPEIPAALPAGWLPAGARAESTARH
jgi:glutathione S-transferase